MMRSLFVAILLIGFSAKSQQLLQPSQYMLNKLLYNPATAGTDENNPIGLYARQQWAGYDYAPATQGLLYHGSVKEAVGLGIHVVNDRNGAFKSLGFTGSGSYRIKLTEEVKLSFGLSFSMLQNSLDGSDFIMNDQSDETLYGATMSSMNPEAGFGMLLYSNDLFVTISAQNLLNSKQNIQANLLMENTLGRHYFMGAGYKLRVTKSLKFEPSILVKMADVAPMQMDISARLFYRENVWGGLSIRSKESLAALVGIQRDRFLIGYAHDFTSSNIKNYSGGTNELYLQYGFRRKDKTSTKFNP